MKSMLRKSAPRASLQRTAILVLAATLPLLPAGGETAAGDTDAAVAGRTGEPVVHVEARERRNTDNELFAAMIEGRLVARSRETGRYQLVSGQQPADYRLRIDIIEVRFVTQGEYERPYDPQTDPNSPVFRQMLNGELDIDLVLERTGQEEPVFEDSIGFVSSRVIEPPEERLENEIVDDLLEKLTDRVFRILKKRVKR